MWECRPVTVSKAAFNFCKTTLAVIVWVALIFKLKWLLIVTAAILAASALLKIQRAPLIVLYSYTIGRLYKTSNELLDENAMRFAHTMGLVINMLCILLLYWVNDLAGWILVFLFAVIKTSGACGYCSALKLYGCMSSGGCCNFLRKQDA